MMHRTRCTIVPLTARSSRRDRGVVLLEFALVMNLLLTLGLGIYEFGFAWRSSAAVTSGARSAARTVSSLATDDAADYQSLSSLRSDLQASGLLSKLQLVVIYKSGTTDGAVPAACTTNAATSALCNVYTGDQVRQMLETDFDTTGCMTVSGWRDATAPRTPDRRRRKATPPRSTTRTTRRCTVAAPPDLVACITTPGRAGLRTHGRRCAPSRRCVRVCSARRAAATSRRGTRQPARPTSTTGCG